MLRTVIYIRKSSDETTDKQTQSLERQWKDISEYIERYNATVSTDKQFLFDPEKDVIREEYSAKEPGRPKFNSMIERIQKKKYDILLCHELSRLSRNPIDNGILVHVLDKQFIQGIQTLTSIFSNTPNDKFTLSLFLNVAKFENDQRGQNTSSGMQTRKSNGGTTNKANMGYKNAGSTKAKRWIEKDGENFDILRKCWDMLLTGEYKITELYEYAMKQGFTYIKSIKTGEEERAVPREGSFRESFSNPYYKGLIKSDTGLVKGNHPPMVTDEEFEKAQIILTKNGFKHSKDVDIRYENLLEELLICGKSDPNSNKMYLDPKIRYSCPTPGCSERYYSATGPKECKKCHILHPLTKFKKIENRTYFAIRGGAKHILPGKKNPVSNIDAKFIEKLIDEKLSHISISEKLYEVFKKRLFTLWTEEESKLNKRIRDKRKDIEAIGIKKTNIIRNGFGGEDLSDSIREGIEESNHSFEQEIRRIESEIIELQDQLDRSFEQAWQGLHALLESKKVFGKDSNPDFEPKRHLLLSMFSNLKFIDGKIIPEWKEPFSTIAKVQSLTKQKSYSACRISEVSCVWLPK